MPIIILMMESIIFVLGWVLLSKLIYSLVRFVYVVYVRKGHNLLERYGKGSYCLITGSTDGIGLCFAQKLAERGFNIILTGRTKEKIDMRVRELSKAHPGVKVLGFLINFSESHKEDYLPRIREMLSGLDISFIVNNVSTITYDRIGDMSPSDIVANVHINVLNHTLLTNEFVPLLQKRSKRSGVIDLSSLLHVYPDTTIPLQSAIKSYTAYLTECVQTDQRYNNVDVLSLSPGWTKTNMLKDIKLSLLTSSPEDVVEGALKDLGVVNKSYGSPKHYVNYLIRSFLSAVLPGKFRSGLISRIEEHLRTYITAT